MMVDGVKHAGKDNDIQVMDVAEMIASAMDL
jgi:hypothetical protein